MVNEVTPVPQPWMLLNPEDCEHPASAFRWYQDTHLYCGDCGLTFTPSVSIHEAIGQKNTALHPQDVKEKAT